MDKEGNSKKPCIVNYKEASYKYWTLSSDKTCKYSTLYTWAKNEEHAIKIANERRIRLLESNSWTTDYEDWKKNKGE